MRPQRRLPPYLFPFRSRLLASCVACLAGAFLGAPVGGCAAELTGATELVSEDDGASSSSSSSSSSTATATEALGGDSEGFVPVGPLRRYDSRYRTPFGAGETRCIPIAGRNGIPDEAIAVALNLTAVSPSAPGFLTAFPRGTARPETSSLNYAPGRPVANGALVTVGDGGAICIRSHASTHVVIDISGYFVARGSYDPLTPYRLLDTREDRPLAASGERCVQVAGRDGVPADAAAIALNLAAVRPAARGYVTAYPAGSAAPNTSNINFAAGRTTANNAIVTPGDGGAICFTGPATTDLVVDVVGYFGNASGYRAVVPRRLHDSRGRRRLAPHARQCIRVTGRAGVSDDAKAVALNITAVNPVAQGFLEVYPEGMASTRTSALNFGAGEVVANGVISRVGNDGLVCVEGPTETDFIVDVVGFWRSRGPRPSPSGGWDYNLAHRCVRSIDSRLGNYYADESECSAPNRNWTIAVQSEKTLQDTCSGPKSQSLPINAGGPLTLDWFGGRDEFGRPNETVVMKTNFIDHGAPCGPGTYTWYSLMDHAHHGGGSFPAPDRFVFEADLWYDDYTPRGAARAIVAWNGEWNGVGIMVEINLASSNWGDAFPGEPDIIQAKQHRGSNFEWVALEGRALGITIPRRQTTRVRIDFAPILANLIARGYLQAPGGGLSTAFTSSVNLATEVRNDATTSSAAAELRVSNYRILGR